MVEAEIRKIIINNMKEICHVSQMQVFATSYYQKNYFQVQIDQRMNEMIQQIISCTAASNGLRPTSQQDVTPVREFTADELVEYNGVDGAPAYVAVSNVVYDVSNVPAWRGGLHNGLRAGQDLTSRFMGCHQGIIEVLERYPKVGVLISGKEEIE